MSKRGAGTSLPPKNWQKEKEKEQYADNLNPSTLFSASFSSEFVFLVNDNCQGLFILNNSVGDP
jgi:hypothetical protein